MFKLKHKKLFLLVLSSFVLLNLSNVYAATFAGFTSCESSSEYKSHEVFVDINETPTYCVEPGYYIYNDTTYTIKSFSGTYNFTDIYGTLGATNQTYSYSASDVLCTISANRSEVHSLDCGIRNLIWNCIKDRNNCNTSCDSDGYYITNNCTEGEKLQISVKNQFVYSATKKAYISELNITHTSDYGIKLTGVTDNTYITDDNYNKLDTKGKISADKIYVIVPQEDAKENISIKIEIDGNKVKICKGRKFRFELLETNNSSNQNTIRYLRKDEKDIEIPISGNTTAEIGMNVGSLKIKKVDAYKKDTGLEGVEFQLYEGKCATDNTNAKLARHADKTLVGGENGIITTGKDGIAQVDNLLFGEYCLVETKPLSTYKNIVSAQNIVISAKQSESTTTIENKPIKIKIGKKKFLVKVEGENDNTTNNELLNDDFIPGATIQINDDKGKSYKGFVTEDDFLEFYFERGKYTLIETIAPAGYMPVPITFQFEVDNEGNVKVLSKDNPHYEYEIDNDGNLSLIIRDETSKIFISKKDISNVEELPGAKIVIECENGFKEEFVSTKEAHKIEATKITNTTCTLTETIAPDNYEKLENKLTFKLDNEGNITTVGDKDDAYYIDGNKITIYNGNFPDTGLGLWIGTLIIGTSLIIGGIVVINNNIKKKRVSA